MPELRLTDEQKKLILEHSAKIDGSTKTGPPMTLKDAKTHTSTFWDKQPVVQANGYVQSEEAIKELTVEDAKKTAYGLPASYEWVSFDPYNDEDLETISTFLDKYYVEDPNNNFRLHYNLEFLQWVFRGPTESLLLGVRTKESNILVGFISGVSTRMQVSRHQLDVAEINFLCVIPKLRTKRLTPVLIQEITRQYQLLGIQQAFYTSARCFVKPFYTAQYYHRTLNPTKLVNSGFQRLEKKADAGVAGIKADITLKDLKRTFKLSEKPSNETFRKMTEDDLPRVYQLFKKYLDRYSVHPIYTFEEFKHTFFGNRIVYCYVTERNDEVSDFISYYCLPSKVLNENKEKYPFIYNAYLFYYTSNYETAYRLINDVLIMARRDGMDVFTALDTFEHECIFNTLNFIKGTGTLHFYMYNWKVKDMVGTQIGKMIV